MTPRFGPARAEPHPDEPRVYTVSEIAQAIGWSLESSFPHVVVQGEISGLKRHGPSGHIYFDLKDAGAKLRVALFKSRVRVAHDGLQDGLLVRVEGRIEFYVARGEVSMVAERVAPVGYGALQARYEALKRALEAEGLFDPGRKRRLPPYPSRIGIVTSPSGAALKDMLRILRHRAPYVSVTIAPAMVQGPGASLSIAAAIRLLNDWGRSDVIVVARGGGSIEDLWAFNEEPVVRAVAASKIPTVTGVGHESDVTLTDLAADQRAATPTHAAQVVAPSAEEICAELLKISKHAKERLRRELHVRAERLAGLSRHRALSRPLRDIHAGRVDLDHLGDGLCRGLRGWVLRRRNAVEGFERIIQAHSPARSLLRARERVGVAEQRARHGVLVALAGARERVRAGGRLLESYNYEGVLRRGYALVWKEGRRLASRAAAVRAGESVTVQFLDAEAGATIDEVRPHERKEKP